MFVNLMRELGRRFVGMLGRVATRIALVVLIVVGELLTVFLCALPLMYWQDSADFKFLFLLTLIVGHVLVIALAIRLWRKAVAREAEREAARFHLRAHRTSNWLDRVLRLSLWIPACIALAFLLFAPEFYGGVSHILHPKPVIIDGKVTRIPLHWIKLLDYNGTSKVCGFIGQGSWRTGFTELQGGRYCLGEFEWRTEPFPEIGRHFEVITGIGPLNCVRRESERFDRVWIDCKDQSGAWIVSSATTAKGADEFVAQLPNLW